MIKTNISRGAYLLITSLSIIILTFITLFIIDLNLRKVESTTVSAQIIDDNDNIEIIEEVEEEIDINDLEVIPEKELQKYMVDNDSHGENLPPYYIKVNYGANVVIIYGKDENNQYTIPVKAMICSTGVATPKSGVYKISSKYRWLKLIGNVYGQYSTRIVGSILFHSVPYLEKDNKTLKYWEYDKLGQSASAGCIRLKVSDAIWIYNNCINGTRVEFYSSSDLSPLGKPTYQKISSYPDYLRVWDPTDPDSNNPWHTYTQHSTKEDNNMENNTNTNDISNDTDNNNIDNNNIDSNNIDSNDIDNNDIDNNDSTPNNPDDENGGNENNTIDENNIT